MVRTTFQKVEYFEKRQVRSRRSDSWKSRGLCKMCTLLIITQVPLRRYFTDVTLVSEDGRHPAAHTVILRPSPG